jgi:hypothetical protein
MPASKAFAKVSPGCLEHFAAEGWDYMRTKQPDAKRVVQEQERCSVVLLRRTLAKLTALSQPLLTLSLSPRFGLSATAADKEWHDCAGRLMKRYSSNTTADKEQGVVHCALYPGSLCEIFVDYTKRRLEWAREASRFLEPETADPTANADVVTGVSMFATRGTVGAEAGEAVYSLLDQPSRPLYWSYFSPAEARVYFAGWGWRLPTRYSQVGFGLRFRRELSVDPTHGQGNSDPGEGKAGEGKAGVAHVVLGCELQYYRPMLALINSLVVNKRQNNKASSRLYLHVFAHVRDAEKSLKMLRCVFDSNRNSTTNGGRVQIIVDDRSGKAGDAIGSADAPSADTSAGTHVSTVALVHHTFSEQAWTPWVLTANMMKRKGLNSPYNWFRYYLESAHFAPFSGVQQVLYMDCDVIAKADVSPLALHRMDMSPRAAGSPLRPYAIGTVELVEPHAQPLREHLCRNRRAQEWRWSRELAAEDGRVGQGDGLKVAGQGDGLKVAGLNTISAGVITIDLKAWWEQRMLEKWHSNIVSHNKSCIWKLQQGALQVWHIWCCCSRFMTR